MKGRKPPSCDLHGVAQRLEAPRIDDIETHLCRELEKLAGRISAGSTIAVAVGSRGIGAIQPLVRTTVRWLKGKRAKPFIIPAMGSHGGATAEGQEELLASYGICERTVGAPIRSSMEVVSIESDLPVRLFMDARASAADGIILINRIKPHTDFRGPYESGLVKMSVIGLGKHEQALEIHRFGVAGLRDLIPLSAERLLATGKILGGVGIVENALEQPAVLEVVRAQDFLAREPALLDLARTLMPSLPSEEIDLLIVDWMGKDLSGIGMDPDVIGRRCIQGEPEPERPRIKAIYARDLTAPSHGNALGIGLADVISRRLYGKIDFRATLENAYTSSFLQRARVPIVAETDAQGIDIALRACGGLNPGRERILRIRDTLHLEEIFVSRALLEELQPRSGIRVSGRSAPLVDSSGRCPDLW